MIKNNIQVSKATRNYVGMALAIVNVTMVS
jgi:hypothetical protein